MVEEKHAAKYAALSLSNSSISSMPDNTTDELMPPPYSDDPPAYSTVAEYSSMYSSTEPSLDYMSKLPFEEPSSARSNSSLPPSNVQLYSQLPANPQVLPPRLPPRHTISHHPMNIVTATPQNIQQPDTDKHVPISAPRTFKSIAPHKALLQPTTSRIVETKVTGHRKIKSHVTDLETGKEYYVKEKTSKNGRKSKAVIVEVGGPKTYVKETPTMTVVCQKK
uniref:Uncharacterized protein n=1 Tax=Arion vulgaris TaxID=1028688 RepID=A0A0B7B266_9EUPU